ncbi:MAG: hypothetical protein AAFZ80_05780 [Cyanobacteria bacterium P01_A01_bin.105]
MTSQTDQIQTLIASINALLGRTSPRLPWVMSKEVTQQRQLLAQTRDYLQSLAKDLTAPGGWGPIDPDSGQLAAEPSAARRTERAGEAEAAQVLQALLLEMQYLKENSLKPLRQELVTLKQQRQSLQSEISTLEAQKLTADASEQQINQFLETLMERLQTNLSQHLAETLAQVSAGQTSDRLLVETLDGELMADQPQLHPAQRLEQLRLVQSQSDQLLLKLDTTLQAVFESLQKSVESYRDSLAEGLDQMHSLGREGEVIFHALVNHIAQQLGQDTSRYLGTELGGSELEGTGTVPGGPFRDGEPLKQLEGESVPDTLAADPTPASGVGPDDLGPDDLGADDLPLGEDLAGLDLDLADLETTELDQLDTNLDADLDSDFALPLLSDDDLTALEDEELTVLQAEAADGAMAVTEPGAEDAPGSDPTDLATAEATDSILNLLDDDGGDATTAVVLPSADGLAAETFDTLFGETSLDETSLDEASLERSDGRPDVAGPAAEIPAAEIPAAEVIPETGLGDDLGVLSLAEPEAGIDPTALAEAEDWLGLGPSDPMVGVVTDAMATVDGPGQDAAQSETETLDSLFGDDVADEVVGDVAVEPERETVASLMELLPAEAAPGQAESETGDEDYTLAAVNEDLLAVAEPESEQRLSLDIDGSLMEQLEADLQALAGDEGGDPLPGAELEPLNSLLGQDELESLVADLDLSETDGLVSDGLVSDGLVSDASVSGGLAADGLAPGDLLPGDLLSGDLSMDELADGTASPLTTPEPLPSLADLELSVEPADLPGSDLLPPLEVENDFALEEMSLADGGILADDALLSTEALSNLTLADLSGLSEPDAVTDDGLFQDLSSDLGPSTDLTDLTELDVQPDRPDAWVADVGALPAADEDLFSGLGEGGNLDDDAEVPGVEALVSDLAPDVAPDDVAPDDVAPDDVAPDDAAPDLEMGELSPDLASELESLSAAANELASQATDDSWDGLRSDLEEPILSDEPMPAVPELADADPQLETAYLPDPLDGDLPDLPGGDLPDPLLEGLALGDPEPENFPEISGDVSDGDVSDPSVAELSAFAAALATVPATTDGTTMDVTSPDVTSPATGVSDSVSDSVSDLDLLADLEEMGDTGFDAGDFIGGGEVPSTRDGLDPIWVLGLDVGTTGLSVVLMDRTEGQVYPLYWLTPGAEEKWFRLPMAAWLSPEPESVGQLAWTAAQQPGAEGVLLTGIKPLLKAAVPFVVGEAAHPDTAATAPEIQWSDTTDLSLQQVLQALQRVLQQCLPERTSGLICETLGLEPEALQQALQALQAVVVGYPTNWPDTYSFNLREAVLGAGLVERVEQIFFIEDAIATLLSGLPNPDDTATATVSRQPSLYNCSWQGGTLAISAGATLTELALVNLPEQLADLTYENFGQRSFPYAGNGLDQDIVCQLLAPEEGRQPLTEGMAATAQDWSWRAELPAGADGQWDSLGLASLTLPAAGETALADRHRLQQRLQSSPLGLSLLEAARHLKLILQHQSQFQLDLGSQRWLVRRRDLESRIFLPYIQRINRHLNVLLSQQGMSAQAVKQVVCTGGSASLPAIARWLRQKFPNATIIQDTYASDRPQSCSRVAYGLVNLARYPQVLDLTRHQYSDYFLLMELLRVFPQQPLPVSGIMHLLEQRGINTKACQLHILALLEGHLPPGLVPTASDRPWIKSGGEAVGIYQALTAAPLFTKQTNQIYVPNEAQGQRLKAYMEAVVAHKAQALQEPLIAQLAVPV